METRKNLRFSADQRIKKFCSDHSIDLIPIPEYLIEKAEFDDKMLHLQDAIDKQGLDIIPLATDKGVDRETLAASIIKYALRASVKAHQLNNLPLELGLTHPSSYILDPDYQTAITRATAIKKLMKDNILILTNITLLNITEMETNINECTDDKNKPKQAISVKKATGTDAITQYLDEVDTPKDNIAKIVHSYLPLLAPEFDAIATVGTSTGIRHIRLIITYTDFTTNVPLAKVKGTITNGTDPEVIKYSTKTGQLREQEIPTGNYTLLSTLPGYTPDTQTNIPIDATKLIHLDIKLHKI